MPDRPPAPARFALCECVLRVARQHALRVGLPTDAAEDCALAFVGRVLLDETEAALRPPETRHLTGTLHDRWVARAAHNHALDFRRHLERIDHWELSWLAAEGDASGREPGADAPLMRREVVEALVVALEDLDAVPRSLLLRHHVEGQSVPEIAAGQGAHAVEQRLLRARRRVRASLERRGWSVGDLLRHLAPSHGTGGPPPVPCDEEE